MKNICVFCSARYPKNKNYTSATIDLAKLIAKKKYTLIYGGSNMGLMSVLSETVRKNGGKTVGILPDVFSHLTSQDDEIVRTKDFAERKATMILRSDAFICLPGGYGTLDEASDIIVGKLIHAHTKPIVFINTEGCYDSLLAHFDKLVEENLADKDTSLYGVVKTPKDAIDYLEKYQPSRSRASING
ncbi:MAG: TIGR00730 family Rossman fold protein [Nanoarchaeota archaeon]